MAHWVLLELQPTLLGGPAPLCAAAWLHPEARQGWAGRLLLSWIHPWICLSLWFQWTWQLSDAGVGRNANGWQGNVVRVTEVRMHGLPKPLRVWGLWCGTSWWDIMSPGFDERKLFQWIRCGWRWWWAVTEKEGEVMGWITYDITIILHEHHGTKRFFVAFLHFPAFSTEYLLSSWSNLRYFREREEEAHKFQNSFPVIVRSRHHRHSNYASPSQL